MRLNDLRAPKGANRSSKRVGRGESSGWGKTAGRGHKGQGARSGTGKPGLGFEGGQMPMYRRMPKRGFVNIFRRNWTTINVDTLASRFPAGAKVGLEAARAAGLASRSSAGLRVLGRGELPHALAVEAHHFTKGAKEKIEAAGGTVTVIGPPAPAESAQETTETTEA